MEENVLGDSRVLTLARLRAFSGGSLNNDVWPYVSTHTDANRARASGLASPVAAGTQIEAFLVGLLVDVVGDSWFHGAKLDVRFIKGAHEGDTITPHAVVERMRDSSTQSSIKWEIWCENQDGDRVAVGSAEWPHPDLI